MRLIFGIRALGRLWLGRAPCDVLFLRPRLSKKLILLGMIALPDLEPTSD